MITLLLLILTSASMAESRWYAELSFPGTTDKYIKISEEETPLSLGKFPWTCTFAKIHYEDHADLKLASRSLICKKGVQQLISKNGCQLSKIGDQSVNASWSHSQTLSIIEGKEEFHIVHTCKMY